MDTFYHSVQLPTTPGIYRITCTSTGKFYIGSAINLCQRWQDHRKRLRRGNHVNKKLQNAWNKYSEQSFTFEVLELVLTPELLTTREQYWFDKLKPFGRKGFNIVRTAGSSLGLRHSPESRKKIKAARAIQPAFTPETREKMRTRMTGNTHLLGHKPSEETRRKMSRSQTGRTHSAETKEKMHRAALGHTVSAETRAKISAGHIGKPSHNRGKKLPLEVREQLVGAHTQEMKTLIIIAPDGTEYIAHGIRQFCREHSLDRSALIRVTKGQQGNHKGWKARFPEAHTMES